MVRRFVAVLILMGFTAFGLAAWLRAQGPLSPVKWRYDYNQARKEAAEKNLPIIIDFGTKDCYWCKKLDEITFRDAKVIGVLSEKFIPLKIDAERDPSLTQLLGITSFPTIVMASPDGKILGKIEGFQDASRFHESMQRALATIRDPEWMLRDYQLAVKWVADAEYPRAIHALQNILEDEKARPIQGKAQKLLHDIEAQARTRLANAATLHSAGKQGEAVETLTETIRQFSGLQAAKDASDMLTKVAQPVEPKVNPRSDKARDLLTQAQDFYKTKDPKDFLLCLDRCEIIMATYGDLPEGQEALQLAGEIKNNPEWLQQTCDALGDRLGTLYLALADSLLKKGQPQQAAFYLERVIRAFPGSRQAESAQIRLGQLQGTPPRRVEIQSARP